VSEPPFDAGQFARQAIFSIDVSDWAIESLETRVSAIEEIIAARWPRSWLLKRRLARELRALSATYAWAGPSFRARRAEAVSEVIARHR
jgi:hypothetical protein